MAMIASSSGPHFITGATLAMGPRTGTPSISVPTSDLSSSRNAATFPNTFFRDMSCAIICPAKPAPMMYRFDSLFCNITPRFYHNLPDLFCCFG